MRTEGVHAPGIIRHPNSLETLFLVAFAYCARFLSPRFSRLVLASVSGVPVPRLFVGGQDRTLYISPAVLFSPTYSHRRPDPPPA